jgi:hypothetical protein
MSDKGFIEAPLGTCCLRAVFKALRLAISDTYGRGYETGKEVDQREKKWQLDSWL